MPRPVSKRTNATPPLEDKVRFEPPPPKVQPESQGPRALQVPALAALLGSDSPSTAQSTPRSSSIQMCWRKISRRWSAPGKKNFVKLARTLNLSVYTPASLRRTLITSASMDEVVSWYWKTIGQTSPTDVLRIRSFLKLYTRIVKATEEKFDKPEASRAAVGQYKAYTRDGNSDNALMTFEGLRRLLFDLADRWNMKPDAGLYSVWLWKLFRRITEVHQSVEEETTYVANWEKFEAIVPPITIHIRFQLRHIDGIEYCADELDGREYPSTGENSPTDTATEVWERDSDRPEPPTPATPLEPVDFSRMIFFDLDSIVEAEWQTTVPKEKDLFTTNKLPEREPEPEQEHYMPTEEFLKRAVVGVERNKKFIQIMSPSDRPPIRLPPRAMPSLPPRPPVSETNGQFSSVFPRTPPLDLWQVKTQEANILSQVASGPSLDDPPTRSSLFALATHRRVPVEPKRDTESIYTQAQDLRARWQKEKELAAPRPLSQGAGRTKKLQGVLLTPGRVSTADRQRRGDRYSLQQVDSRARFRPETQPEQSSLAVSIDFINPPPPPEGPRYSRTASHIVSPIRTQELDLRVRTSPQLSLSFQPVARPPQAISPPPPPASTPPSSTSTSTATPRRRRVVPPPVLPPPAASPRPAPDRFSEFAHRLAPDSPKWEREEGLYLGRGVWATSPIHGDTSFASTQASPIMYSMPYTVPYTAPGTGMDGSPLRPDSRQPQAGSVPRRWHIDPQAAHRGMCYACPDNPHAKNNYVVMHEFAPREQPHISVPAPKSTQVVWAEHSLSPRSPAPTVDSDNEAAAMSPPWPSQQQLADLTRSRVLRQPLPAWVCQDQKGPTSAKASSAPNFSSVRHQRRKKENKGSNTGKARELTVEERAGKRVRSKITVMMTA